jgi:hypothetical protein
VDKAGTIQNGWLTFDKPLATLLVQLFRMSLILSKVVTSAICDRYELDILQLEPRHTSSFKQHQFVIISLKRNNGQ